MKGGILRLQIRLSFALPISPTRRTAGVLPSLLCRHWKSDHVVRPVVGVRLRGNKCTIVPNYCRRMGYCRDYGRDGGP